MFWLLTVIPLIVPVWEHVLKPYQKRRILILLRPDLDPLGAGYHIRQSKIAIGSGMLWGKGFLNGTQNKLHFLPEKHTDFIFSVWAEEWGFVGCAVLLFLFCLLIFLTLRVATRSQGQVWVPDSGRNERPHSVAGVHQYRHGYRGASGGGNYSAFRQLRGVLAHHPVPGNRVDRKCEHASLCVSNTLRIPGLVLKITNAKSVINCDNFCFSLANTLYLCY